MAGNELSVHSDRLVSPRTFNDDGDVVVIVVVVVMWLCDLAVCCAVFVVNIACVIKISTPF